MFTFINRSYIKVLRKHAKKKPLIKNQRVFKLIKIMILKKSVNSIVEFTLASVPSLYMEDVSQVAEGKTGTMNQL